MYIYLNNEKHETSFGLTIIQTCSKLGYQIPRFCYHEKLKIAGNCRMCLVEISRPKGPSKPKPAAACAISVVDNMFIHTNTVLVKRARESVLEFLLINHPLDCPICDQGGECDLQDQTIVFGSDRGRFYDVKRAVSDKEFGPLIKTVMTRCIHCTRCVRFGNDIAGVSFLGTMGRGYFTEIAPYVKELLGSELSGNIIDLCPVGALTSKPYAFKARSWELKVVETIDILDSFCSNIRLDLRGVDILRVLPRLNEEINEEWITDKTRFFHDGLLKQRIQKPFVKFGTHFLSVSWKNVFLWLSFRFVAVREHDFVGISGMLNSIESLVSLKDFLNNLGSSSFCMEQSFNAVVDLPSNFLLYKGLKQLEMVDFCILLGFNPRLELPLLNVRLRKAVKNRNAFIIVFGYLTTLNFKTYNITNAVTDFLLFVEGKSNICKKLMSSKVAIVLQGNSLLYRVDSLFFFKINEFFSNVFKRVMPFSLNFNFVSISTGFLNSCEVGLFNVCAYFNFVRTNKLRFLYLLGVDDKRILSLIARQREFFFTIFQGHTGNEISAISDVILPSCNFTEQFGSFLNLSGRVQHAKFIKLPPSLARSDWSIFVALALFLQRPLKYSNAHGLRKRIFQVSSCAYLKDVKHFIPVVRFKKMANSTLVVSNFPFLSPFFNFYNSDTITKSSQILALVSNKFVKNRNFFMVDV